jgi:hypothetical protein
MPQGLRDGLGRSFNQRLELAIGGQGKLLDDRGGQNALAISEVSHIIAELAQLCRQGRAGQALHAHLGITGHADKR